MPQIKKLKNFFKNLKKNIQPARTRIAHRRRKDWFYLWF